MREFTIDEEPPTWAEAEEVKVRRVESQIPESTDLSQIRDGIDWITSRHAETIKKAENPFSQVRESFT